MNAIHKIWIPWRNETTPPFIDCSHQDCSAVEMMSGFETTHAHSEICLIGPGGPTPRNLLWSHGHRYSQTSLQNTEWHHDHASYSKHHIQISSVVNTMHSMYQWHKIDFVLVTPYHLVSPLPSLQLSLRYVPVWNCSWYETVKLLVLLQEFHS